MTLEPGDIVSTGTPVRVGEWERIPLSGHLPQEEQPDEVNRILLDFLSDWIG